MIRRIRHVYVDRPVVHHHRTGAPSPMHELEGDNRKVSESYATMYRKYGPEHGALGFAATERLTKAFPNPLAP